MHQYMLCYVFSLQFQQQLQELVEKNAATLGAKKKLEADLHEVHNHMYCCRYTHNIVHGTHHISKYKCIDHSAMNIVRIIF